MGRLLLIVGILMTIAGTVGSTVGFLVPMQGVVGAATNTSQSAAALCTNGERLEETQGVSSYTPGHGTGRPVNYYCVDKNGVRREVTGAVVSSLLGSTASGVLGGFMVSGAFCGLSGLGVLFIIIGVILIVKRRLSTPQVTAYQIRMQ